MADERLSVAIAQMAARCSEADVADTSEAKVTALRKAHAIFEAYQRETTESVLPTPLEREALKVEAEVEMLERELQERCAAENAPKVERKKLRAALEARLLLGRSAALSVMRSVALDAEPPKADAFYCDEHPWDQELTWLRQQAASIGGGLTEAGGRTCLLAGSPGAEDTTAIYQDIAELEELVSSAKEQHCTLVRRKRAARQSHAELHVECARLLSWCRQQRMGLDALAEPDHVHEFCTSLLGNVTTMDSNFDILLDESHHSFDDCNMGKALADANCAWIQLLLSALEKLRDTMCEINSHASLEEEVQRLSDYSDRAAAFLKEFWCSSSTLSEKISATRPGELLARFSEHEVLSDRLKDFAKRMRLAREGYRSLCRSVFSSVMAQDISESSTTANERWCEEYRRKITELQRWSQPRIRDEPMREIEKRIVLLRDIIDDEQRALEGPRS